MFCNKCGNKLDNNSKFCNKCGAPNNYIPIYQPDNINSLLYPQKKSKLKLLFIGFGVGSIGVIIILLIVIFTGSSSYYFSETENTPDVPTDITNSNTNSPSKYKTVIITDNIYDGVSIKGVSDANALISKDSTDQKSSCPKEILNVENEIIKKYNITAVNLCEMDTDFAKELINVLEHIYNEYPEIRGYLTNISLWNGSFSERNVIAEFMPIFQFASSNTSSTYPWVIKTQIFLNSSYFLNKNKLATSVKENSAVGHFPPNASIYSPLAHELGHYISYIAMMKYYSANSILLIDDNNFETLLKLAIDFSKGNHSLSMLEEAYNNYKNDTGDNVSFDDWRGSISKYALAKDDAGDYIYDETIAEAFHDVYLNSSNAKPASKYITAVLKERLKG